MAALYDLDSLNSFGTLETLPYSLDALIWENGGFAESTVTLGGLTAAGTGEVLITGTSSTTLGALTSSGQGGVEVDGETNATLGAVSLSGTGQVSILLDTLTATAEGTVSGEGSSATIDPVAGAEDEFEAKVNRALDDLRRAKEIERAKQKALEPDDPEPETPTEVVAEIIQLDAFKQLEPSEPVEDDEAALMYILMRMA